MDQYIDQDREFEINKQQMAAAAYFFKKTDQYIAFEKIKNKNEKRTNSIKLTFNFHKVILNSVPYLPPSLHKSITSISTENKIKKESEKIQVFVQLLSCPETSSCLSIDAPNNCISLTNPTPSRKFTASNAPKLFPVDSIINEDCPIMEICSNSLGPVIRSVANGEDACVISFGNVPANDLNPIIGSDKSANSIGVMPCAIVWLFNYIKTIRKQEYARFSVRISAAEISGRQENCRDLLLSISNPSSDSSQPLNSSSSLFNSLVELRAVNVEKAAYYLDYALTERSKSEETGLSHMFLTLHLYQYHLQNDSGISGGRSKLHIIDLGCGRLSEDVESTALSIQGISKVVYALWSHQRHIPNSDSILTQTLKRLIVNSYTMMQTSMIIKVSGKETQYNEALQVVQLASKLCRQKSRLSKLSSSTCSDDNSSSSDSFSIRRMTKFRSQFGHDSKRFMKSISISSDIDATSSSEVSCDTVIYRGQPPSSPSTQIRGSADGCSQGQIGISQSESEEKKPEPKLTLFQLKRRTGNKTNSNAWPKVAVKKAKEVMKLGQELWVDGPEAFCSNTGCRQFVSNKSTAIAIIQNKDINELEKNLVVEKLNDKIENKEDMIQNSGNQTSRTSMKNSHFAEIPINRIDHLVKNKHHLEKISNENALKSMMVTDWLRNQPEHSITADKYKPPILHVNTKGNKTENDKQNNGLYSSQRIKNQKPLIEPIQTDHKISATNFSRIEDWIRAVSIESPKRTTSPVDCGVVMTQSLYSPSCSPYHSTETRFNSFSNVPLSPPSAPINYSQNFCEQNSNSLRGCSVPPASIGSEIENECSRLWFYNPLINDRNLMPFVDIIDDANNNRSSSFSGAPIVSISQLDNLRNSSFQNPPNLTNCQIPLPQYELNNIPVSNNLINYNIPKYSTLPLDSHSPKHNNSKYFQKSKPNETNDGVKSNEIFNFSPNLDTSLKLNIDNKRTLKETKKKENKKGFGFLNHLIRNKKLKKDLPINRSGKEESNNTTETVCPTVVKSHECQFSDSVDYVKKAGPPLLLTSPYHTVTNPKIPTARADSSGHGSDCSSFKESKSTQVSVNFHQENSGYRFLPYGRAGSSGYESVVRDSELSSHNDSASECSAPTNVALQSKSIPQTPAANSNKNILVPSNTLNNNNNTKITTINCEHDKKPDSINYLKESQKVFELIKTEKICMLEMEQEDMKNELINVLNFFNDDIDNSRKFLETHLSDIESSEDMKSPDNLNSTNQTLRSVLSRYQSNLYMVTSFIGKPPSDSLYE